MAFSNTVIEKKELPGGYIMERGTWDGDSVTTGTITLDTSTTFGNVDVADIIMWSFSNDADHATLPARDVAPNKIKITFTDSDTGTYTLIGRAA